MACICGRKISIFASDKGHGESRDRGGNGRDPYFRCSKSGAMEAIDPSHRADTAYGEGLANSLAYCLRQDYCNQVPTLTLSWSLLTRKKDRRWCFCVDYKE